MEARFFFIPDLEYEYLDALRRCRSTMSLFKGMTAEPGGVRAVTGAGLLSV